MRVTVDPQRCQGHALCAMNAPDVFVLDDDEGHASVEERFAREGVPAEMDNEVTAAIEGCPEMAISEI